ncbi:hypothetical protein OSB04_012979 [Centaurea solstitialis]|uniref:Homeobox domain-containing protein n=1 Tax=Centaurea solstitialis TaxID=347529 RepID=A0AA38WMX8_9ASTR|nr:hypothetical protein OSB04_012979 [Centaurea solstitialis]
MELGLTLGGDAPPSKTTIDGFTPGTTTPANKSLGFCMALGMNPSNNQHLEKEKPQIQDDQEDEYDDEEEDDDDDGEEDEMMNLKEKGDGMKEMIVGSQRICSLNPPVQLDLLPSAPVPRHTPFPWSSDNGSSEGGSSGNARFDVRRMPAAEEATSSFRLDFMSYRRIGNANINDGGGIKNNNNKRGFEIGNDVVEVERASSRASDEDENGISRKKLRLSKEQSAYLEESFKEHNTLNPQKQKLALAEQLNLRPRQVEVWFQNRRARTKLKQTEVDYEYLKRCCETLTDENRRLHKELQELRALKTTSNPFYMQLPATTLTMCPSCERVATTSAPPPSTTMSAKPVEPNSNKPSTTTSPLTLSRSLIFPVSHAPPCSNNSHHQPAAPS